MIALGSDHAGFDYKERLKDFSIKSKKTIRILVLFRQTLLIIPILHTWFQMKSLLVNFNAVF